MATNNPSSIVTGSKKNNNRLKYTDNSKKVDFVKEYAYDKR